MAGKDGETSVLDAINFAMDNDGELLPEANAGIPSAEGHEDPKDDLAADQTVEGGGDEEGESETPLEEEVVEDTDAEAEARGAERDPVTGKFIKKEAKAPEGEVKPEAKIDPATGKPVVEAKKPDPVNDPIPKDLKQSTRDRMQTLVTTVKEKDAALTEVQTNFDYMVGGIQATGASPEQYGETLSWLALFNSPDPAQQTKALELVESVAERLATLLGKERTVGDPLAAHVDLKEAVRTGKLTIEYAKEMARTRNGQQFRGQLNDNNRQQQEQQQQFEREQATARGDLSALETTLKATDAQWEIKKPILVAALGAVFKTIPPREWKGKFEQAYRNLKLPAGMGAVAKPKVPVNQPLRAGKQPAGGAGSGGPKSAVEAMSEALGSMGK